MQFYVACCDAATGHSPLRSHRVLDLQLPNCELNNASRSVLLQPASVTEVQQQKMDKCNFSLKDLSWCLCKYSKIWKKKSLKWKPSFWNHPRPQLYVWRRETQPDSRDLSVFLLAIQLVASLENLRFSFGLRTNAATRVLPPGMPFSYLHILVQTSLFPMGAVFNTAA